MSFWVKLVRVVTLPFLAYWAVRTEARCWEEGRPLTDVELDLARRVGVSDVGGIRVFVVEEIPLPVPEGVFRLLRDAEFPVFRPAGMCLGRVIFLTPDYCEKLTTAHELRHAAQYEKIGGIRVFLSRYIEECLSAGYFDAALERDARAAAERAVA